jgi:hypothetical protein
MASIPAGITLRTVLFATIACWLSIAGGITFLTQSIHTIDASAPHTTPKELMKTAQILDSVLSLPQLLPQIIDVESMYDPFADKVATIKNSATTRINARKISLYIKGLLLNGKPFVVLASDDGKNRVCGIGDTVLGKKVVLINSKGVTLQGNVFIPIKSQVDSITH